MLEEYSIDAEMDPTSKDCSLRIRTNGKSISDYKITPDNAKVLIKELTAFVNSQKSSKIESVAQLFVDELNLIKDDEIRAITKEVLDALPLDPFLYKGASSSGKYHPAECRGALGLTLHTKYAVQAGLVLLDQDVNLDEDEHDNDLIISALILHDGFKYGKEGTEQHTVSDHPEIIADFLMEKYKNEDPNSNRAFYFRKLSELTRSHHGKWGKSPCNNRCKEYVHIADMIASRAHLIRFNAVR